MIKFQVRDFAKWMNEMKSEIWNVSGEKGFSFPGCLFLSVLLPFFPCPFHCLSLTLPFFVSFSFSVFSLCGGFCCLAILSPAVFISFQRHILYSLFSYVSLSVSVSLWPAWRQRKTCCWAESCNSRGNIGEQERRAKGMCFQLRAFVISLWSANLWHPAFQVFLYPCLTFTTGV